MIVPTYRWDVCCCVVCVRWYICCCVVVCGLGAGGSGRKVATLFVVSLQTLSVMDKCCCCCCCAVMEVLLLCCCCSVVVVALLLLLLLLCCCCSFVALLLYYCCLMVLSCCCVMTFCAVFSIWPICLPESRTQQQDNNHIVAAPFMPSGWLLTNRMA